MNEIKVIETQIQYYNSKNSLEHTIIEKRLNDRINKLQEQVEQLQEQVESLLNELKPVIYNDTNNTR